MRLEGKYALITGGTSGIGLEAARAFIREGARVAVLGRNQDRLNKALASLSPMARGFAADVASPDALGREINAAANWLGGIDVLFANAGISEAPDLSNLTTAAYDTIMDINVKGVVFTVAQALPLLRSGASILLTGSVAARKGRPGDAIYAASKGAVRSFGRTLAMQQDVLARGIRVNVLTPGAIETPLTREATRNPEVNQYISDMVPMGRWGHASEVAHAAVFLASDESSYMTGGELTVDGGLAHV